MPQKIKELQNQLEKIIKEKKILQIRSSWQCSQRDMSFWKMFLVSVRDDRTGTEPSHGDGI